MLTSVMPGKCENAILEEYAYICGKSLFKRKFWLFDNWYIHAHPLPWVGIVIRDKWFLSFIL